MTATHANNDANSVDQSASATHVGEMEAEAESLLSARQLEHEKSKLERWLQKLSTADAVRTFGLNQPSHLANCALKFTRMIETLRRGIEQEWIEELAQDGSDSLDYIVESMGSVDGGSITIEKAILYTRFPPFTSSIQRPLDPQFRIGQFSDDDGNHNNNHNNSNGNQNTVGKEVHSCSGCGEGIWNRCWLDNSVMEQCQLETDYERRVEIIESAIRLCSRCYCRQIPKRHAPMVMFERFSVRFLIDLYHSAVARFNQTFQPLIGELLPSDNPVSNYNLDSNGCLIDEYAQRYQI
jgi:hypothetical protein